MHTKEGGGAGRNRLYEGKEIYKKIKKKKRKSKNKEETIKQHFGGSIVFCVRIHNSPTPPCKPIHGYFFICEIFMKILICFPKAGISIAMPDEGIYGKLTKKT